MATYEELHAIAVGGESETLVKKLRIAVIVAAETIRNELDTTPNHVNRLLWAKEAYSNPQSVAHTMLHAVLAANKDAAPSAITGASDAAVQTNVDAVIDIFAAG